MVSVHLTEEEYLHPIDNLSGITWYVQNVLRKEP